LLSAMSSPQIVTEKAPPPGPLFLAALASIALINPLAVHLFMPVIPAVKSSLGVSSAVAQLTFSIALFVMSFATLVYGSLADQYGRRPVLLSGLVLFLAGSLISVFADSALVLVIGRLVQAIGAGCGMTLARTITRDAYGADRLVQVLAYLTMFSTVGPMIAPPIGGVLVDTLGWRSVFGFALAVGAVISAMAFAGIKETRPASAGEHARPGILGSYAVLFSHARFTAFVLQSGFSTGAFMTVASASASLMPEYMHRPPTEFGLYFLLFPVGFMLGNWISSRLSNRVTIESMVAAGSLITFVAVAVQATLLIGGAMNPLAIFLTGAFLTMGQGIALPYGQAGAMAIIPRLAGTAAGIGVFLQFFSGAAFSQLYGFFANGTPGPMVAIATATAALGLIVGLIPYAMARRQPSVV
jgi:DHA1 family bicyclomycin/chloramphenicol resistance-like MFS transporter